MEKTICANCNNKLICKHKDDVTAYQQENKGKIPNTPVTISYNCPYRAEEKSGIRRETCFG